MKYLIIIFSFLFNYSASAAVSGYYEGLVSEVGYEGGRGLIKINNTSLYSSGCSGLYVDLSDSAKQVAYSTALAAKMANVQVKIRYVTDGSKYYSYCSLFQLTIIE